MLDDNDYGSFCGDMEHFGNFSAGIFRHFSMGGVDFYKKKRQQKPGASFSSFFSNGNGRCLYVDGMKKTSLKGSYTVEMALISGVWLLVIFSSLFLIWGTQIKVWKTAQICELSVYGSGQAVINEGSAVEKTKQKAAEMQETYSISGGKKEISVAFQQNFKIPFQNLNWNMEQKWKSKVIKPVEFIEKVQKYRRFSENIK